MQVYRGLPILTNQPTDEQRARVRHHLVGCLDPWKEFSAAAYAPLAQAAMDDIIARGRRVVLEGGSGLYLRAGLGGLAFGAAPSPALRAELDAAAAEHPDELVRRLRELDPAGAERIDLDNPRRVVRALETVIAQGGPLTDDRQSRLWRSEPRYAYRLFALDVARGDVRRRVAERAEHMMVAGLVAEVERAAAAAPLSRTVRQAIGVDEALAVLAGELTPETAARRIVARTNRLVRRQSTWMRKLPDAVIIPTSGRLPDDVADDIAGLLA